MTTTTTPPTTTATTSTKKRKLNSQDSEPRKKVRKSSEEEEKTKPKIKRSEADIRGEMLEKGALLLEFNVERNGLNTQQSTRWRNVEKKGFLVTEKGCLIPALCHWFQNRSKKVGYDCALSFFKGQVRQTETVGTTNKHGWDCEDNISHLCHRNECCAYTHIELVPRWKNLKRNYCGLEGICDCGMDPPCVDTYHPPSFVREPDRLLTYETPDLSKKIKAMFDSPNDNVKVKVKILPKNHYDMQDQKRINRNARIKGSIRTAKETKRKQQKNTNKINNG